MHRKNDDSEWIDFFLKVHSWSGVIINAEPDKCEELKWFNISELPEDMITYIKLAIERCHNQTQLWFNSVGW